MDHRGRAFFGGGFCQMARAIDMDRVHLPTEYTAQVDDRGRTMNCSANAFRIGDVGPDEAELPDLAERLDDIGLARIALRDPDTNAGFHQEFANVTADESTTAEDGYKLF
jgi:hypothetical protein